MKRKIHYVRLKLFNLTLIYRRDATLLMFVFAHFSAYWSYLFWLLFCSLTFPLKYHSGEPKYVEERFAGFARSSCEGRPTFTMEGAWTRSRWATENRRVLIFSLRHVFATSNSPKKRRFTTLSQTNSIAPLSARVMIKTTSSRMTMVVIMSTTGWKTGMMRREMTKRVKMKMISKGRTRSWGKVCDVNACS